MVKNVTSLGRSGLQDWLIQRVSAIVIALYSFFLIGYAFFHYPLNFTQWSYLFSCVPMKIITFLFMLSVVMHAWIGLWTVFTDYIKCTYLRVSLQVLLAFTLLYYLIWTVVILRGAQ